MVLSNFLVGCPRSLINRKLFLVMIDYSVFSHAIFVSQNNEMAAMFVSQTSPVGVELFSYENAFFCSSKSPHMLAT